MTLLQWRIPSLSITNRTKISNVTRLSVSNYWKPTLHPASRAFTNKPDTKPNYPFWRNKHGEEIKYGSRFRPAGYAFVATGDALLTRLCREMTQNAGKEVYACYHPKSNQPKQIGLFVPREISEEAMVIHTEKKQASEEKKLLKVGKAYPNMPLEDKNRFVRTYMRARYEQAGMDFWVSRYILDIHTPWSFTCKEHVARDAWKKANAIKSFWEGKGTESPE